MTRALMMCVAPLTTGSYVDPAPSYNPTIGSVTIAGPKPGQVVGSTPYGLKDLLPDCWALRMISCAQALSQTTPGSAAEAGASDDLASVARSYFRLDQNPPLGSGAAVGAFPNQLALQWSTAAQTYSALSPVGLDPYGINYFPRQVLSPFAAANTSFVGPWGPGATSSAGAAFVPTLLQLAWVALTWAAFIRDKSFILQGMGTDAYWQEGSGP